MHAIYDQCIQMCSMIVEVFFHKIKKETYKSEKRGERERERGRERSYFWNYFCTIRENICSCDLYILTTSGKTLIASNETLIC